jgi:alpha-beta hydrolase superfamily lysophospholipase
VSLGVVVLAALVGTGFSGVADRSPTVASAAAPRPLQLAQTCVTRAEKRRVVRFRTSDRVRLIGLELGRGPNVVVLAHQGGGGAPGNLCAWMPYARSLARSGYRVLVFDHRGHGSSGRPAKVSRYLQVDLDVRAAVAVMRARGATRIVLGGASLGGSAALAAAARIAPAVQGVFTIGSPLEYGPLDGLADARSLTVPALFTSAVGDDPFDDDARTMFEACASPDKRLELFPGTRHGAPVLRDPQAKAVVDAWVAVHLRN